jgi:hypothetical protein
MVLDWLRVKIWKKEKARSFLCIKKLALAAAVEGAMRAAARSMYQIGKV